MDGKVRNRNYYGAAAGRPPFVEITSNLGSFPNKQSNHPHATCEYLLHENEYFPAL